MEELPEALFSTAQVLDIECRATSGPVTEPLMERAGRSVLTLLRGRWPRARRVTVICGPGNNGGDGYVAARLAREAGMAVQVLSPAPHVRLQGDAAHARGRLLAAGVAVEPFSAGALGAADVVVDALFGTGLQRPVEGEWLAAVRAINACGVPVLSVDLPSGLDADSGRILGEAVRADVTQCMIVLKPGLFTGFGRECCGEICHAGLDVPAGISAAVMPAARRIVPANLRHLLHPRPRHAHKGGAGRVLVVGGGPGMGGAAHLAGVAAYRAGAGLVTVATHPAHAACLAQGRPELIVHGVDGPAGLEVLLERADVIAAGPGLGQDRWAQELWAVLRTVERPLVVDADALNLLAATAFVRQDWILTPHPGEAARLLGWSAADVQNDRFAALRQITRRYGGTCILKGSGSLVWGGGDEPVWLCDRGNPGMASGGMGDVLTGIIAGLQAQGLPALHAARMGVWCHAAAADAAVRRDGERGLLALDLLPRVRVLVNELARA